MKSLFGIILFLFLNEAMLSQTGWVQINSGTTLNLYDVQFINDLTGYICGGGTNANGPGFVKKSTNGGLSWFTILNSTGEMNGLSFIDINTGTVVGWSSIMRTTNGGTTWITQNAPASCSGYYRSIYFLNSTIGVIAGDVSQPSGRGIILFTSNGGLTWLDRCYATFAVYFGVRVFDPNTAIVVGTSGAPGSIIKTTNFGLSWMAQNIGGVYRGVSFVNNNYGMVSGSGTNNIGKTVNSGANWNFQTISSTFTLNDVNYIDTSTSFTVGISGAIFKTTTGGDNWVQLSSGTSNTLRSVFFINQNTGWACGDAGTLVKTTDGGITAIQPISNIIPISFLLEQNYPNPFNPITKIKFDIAKSSFVRIVIFDILGRVINILANQNLEAGRYEIDFNASNLPSGVYFYKLITDNFSESKKMVLIK